MSHHFFLELPPHFRVSRRVLWRCSLLVERELVGVGYEDFGKVSAVVEDALRIRTVGHVFRHGKTPGALYFEKTLWQRELMKSPSMSKSWSGKAGFYI